MKLFRYDTLEKIKPRALASIARFGFSPEHSYGCFVHSAEEGQRPVFFENEEGHGVFAYVSDSEDEWESGDPLAPVESRGALLSAVVSEMFSSQKTKKVYLETDDLVRRRILKDFRPSYRVSRINERLIWPVLDLNTYDDSLLGSQFKPLRNVRNRFLREHSVEFVLPSSVPKNTLHDLIESWEKNRPANHTVYSAEYYALVDDDFSGTTGARAMVVDGIPHGMSAGWPIPNSRSYYHSLALHTFAYWGLGEMLMLESLAWMKHAGYQSANLGGSDAPLFSFKKKFGAQEAYTSCFYTVQRIKK